MDDEQFDLDELEDAGVVVHEIDVVEGGSSKETNVKEVHVIIRERNEVDPGHIRVAEVSNTVGDDSFISCKLKDSSSRHVTEDRVPHRDREAVGRIDADDLASSLCFRKSVRMENAKKGMNKESNRL